MTYTAYDIHLTVLSRQRALKQGNAIEEVEVLACREGVFLAAEWIWKPAVLETDCGSVVDMVRNSAGQRSQHTFIVSEILELATQLLAFSIRLYEEIAKCSGS